jgi:hypothetical protein
MKLNDQKYKEIADELLCGMVAIIEKSSGKIDSHPTDLDSHFMMDEENPWQELIDKVEENWEDYILIEPMPSFESFKIMERFAHQLEEGKTKTEAIRALEMRKPFRHFKDVVESSEFRQNWFDFQLQENINWVKLQVEGEIEL